MNATEINLETVPVVATERHMPRKEQAAAARRLFKTLGLRGISVKTPRYSMASTVDVSVPNETVTDADFILDGVDYRHHCYGDMPNDVPAKAKLLEHRRQVEAVESILDKAFPNHDDRSDSQTDYFDRCWSVD